MNLAELDPGPNPLVVEWNGQEILVPRLDDSDARRAALTTMANIAAYFTTGDERILDNFAGTEDNPDLGIDGNARQHLMDKRNAFLEQHPEIANNPDLQFTFFDTADDPAAFEFSSVPLGQGFVVDGNHGTIFLGVSIEPGNYHQVDDFAMVFPVRDTLSTTDIIRLGDGLVTRVSEFRIGFDPGTNGEFFAQ